MEQATKSPSKVFIYGDSRIRSIEQLCKSKHLGHRYYTHYKGGSTINWCRQESAMLRERNCTVVFQTGINNVLNTKQTEKNILYQIGELISENREKNRKVIFTSILPADLGNPRLMSVIEELNQGIQRKVTEMGGIYLDLQDYFVRNKELIRSFYLDERNGHIHLNKDGATVLMRVIEAKLTSSTPPPRTGPTPQHNYERQMNRVFRRTSLDRRTT